MRLAILGAGAWGTALAVRLAERHEVRLWARDAAQTALMRQQRRNERYLPGIAWPAALEVSHDFDAVLAPARGADGLVVIATPMAALADMLVRLPPEVREVLWLSKGFELGSGRLGHEIAQALRPQLAACVVSGPSFALEVARGQPTALVAASSEAALAERAVQALHGEALRVYSSNDPIGVEVGGAVKNVLALATGIADGMQLGLNARAALVTRGLAEMTRLAVALGGRAETCMGLSGLGDLVLTATGDLSRNRQVGLLLARGLGLAQILAQLGHVAEGVTSAAMALQRGRACGIEMPITQAVTGVLEGRATPREALVALLAREARAEDA